MTVYLKPEQHWVCPNCNATDVTHEAEPHTRFHGCRGLNGLTAPMVPEGTRCKVEAVEREDYVGREVVTRDGENRPIMRVETTREDGNDVAVFAPCASAGVDAFGTGSGVGAFPSHADVGVKGQGMRAD